MFVQVSQPCLLNALQRVMKAVPANSPTPLLSGVKLLANANGLTITSCKSDMMLQYEIPPDAANLIVQAPGSFVVPARYFFGIVRLLPAEFVTLELHESAMLSIRSGHAAYRLCGTDAGEYPQVTRVHRPAIVGFPNDLLKTVIEQVSFAVSSSEARPVLTGVSFQFDGAHLRLLATDSIRLASRVIAAESGSGNHVPNLIIPGKHLSDFAKMLNDEQGTTDIYMADNVILFHTSRLLMQSSLIEGTYPSVDKVMPQTFSTQMALDSVHFLQALERVSLLAGEGSIVQLHTGTENTVVLVAKTAEIGDVREEVRVEEWDGAPLSIVFNGKYMMDIMRAVACQRTTLRFSGNWGPILVQPADSLSFYLLTPIRSNNSILLTPH